MENNKKINILLPHKNLNEIQKIVLASSNPHKIEEMNAIASAFPFKFVLPDCKNFNPVENGKTFEENAQIKAIEASKISSGELFMADDSGLCVEYLNDAPGIYSARYANNPQERIKKLLFAMKNAKNRNAYFTCALCLVDKNGIIIHRQTSKVYGEIAHSQTGTNGFGYDPVFIVKGLNKTMAQLSQNEKNTLSHRGQAVNNMLKWLSEVIYGRKFR